MFKFTGSIFIIVSSYMIFNRRTFVYYCTYKFLHKVVVAIEKLQYEKNSNMTYDDIFKKINFNWKHYIEQSKNNRYIVFEETEKTMDFFANLGKRDSMSEEKYINHNLRSFIDKKNSYHKKYCDCQKVYAVCGISFGLLIVVFLI